MTTRMHTSLRSVFFEQINSIPGPVFGSSVGCRYRENIFSLVNRRTPSGEKNMFCLGSCWALQLAQLHDAQRPVDIRDDTNFPNLKMRLKNPCNESKLLFAQHLQSLSREALHNTRIQAQKTTTFENRFFVNH